MKKTKYKPWLRGLFHLTIIVSILALILFGTAGRVDWLAAWVLTFLFTFFLLIVMIWGITRAPDLMQERSNIAANVKTWDKLINIAYTVLLLVLLVVTGLDAGRFGWSKIPLFFQILGGLGFVLAGAIILWTLTENAYLSRWARIQEDRGQEVITSGPYHFIRHPMYSAIILLFFSIPLLLSSCWGLIPAGLIAILYVLRTALEDQMLRQELPGYEDYAQCVSYRLIPWIW